jgi:hypothetical protein
VKAFGKKILPRSYGKTLMEVKLFLDEAEEKKWERAGKTLDLEA